MAGNMIWFVNFFFLGAESLLRKILVLWFELGYVQGWIGMCEILDLLV
jgi:hypothetical protein